MPWSLGSIREKLEFSNQAKGEIRQLFHPYYVVNLMLAFSFLFVKLTRPICDFLFAPSPEACELDMRETEIMFFLLVVIMIRSRKTGSMTMVAYLSSGFMYAKCANLILFFLADPRLGLVYALLFLLQGMLLPEPTYKGPENIVYFSGTSLGEELARDTKVVWMITFYAAWSPSCINFTHVFAKLSADYNLPNLKFGKIDVGRYADVAAEYHINTSSLSRQLPTLIMFQEGKELGRVPAIVNGTVQKFFFKEEDIVAAFDMNNLYAKCKEDKKFVPSEAKEAKKEK
jgi:thiol-disulfide isomerase/thioredoxin